MSERIIGNQEMTTMQQVDALIQTGRIDDIASVLRGRHSAAVNETPITTHITEAASQRDSIPGMSEATGEAPSVASTIAETRQARFVESPDIARMRAMNRIPAMEGQNPVPQTRIVPF